MSIEVWDEIARVCEGFSEAKHNEVSRMMARAEGYAWGYQDRGPKAEYDTQKALDFAKAYALHAARYEAGKIGFRRNVADAYKRWQETGEIE